MDLHADDSRISEDETDRNGDDGTHDKGLKICRTVTQVRLLHPSVEGGISGDRAGNQGAMMESAESWVDFLVLLGISGLLNPVCCLFYYRTQSHQFMYSCLWLLCVIKSETVWVTKPKNIYYLTLYRRKSMELLV